jgi:translation initiation factor 4E
MSSSTLPAPSQQANKAALAAALAENPLTDTHPSDAEPGEIQEVDMHAQAEGIRTVFSDPTNFNVKVCLFLRATHSTHAARYQHPLYSPWTLWFDSPATKGRNLPQTPITSFPQTPVVQTPSAAAAQGWMEDIKRVISFNSVEEFWG